MRRHAFVLHQLVGCLMVVRGANPLALMVLDWKGSFHYCTERNLFFNRTSVIFLDS